MNQESILPLMKQGLGGFGGPQFKLTQINGQGGMIGGGPIVLVVRPDLKWLASFNYLEGGPDSLKIWFVGFGGEYTLFPGALIELNLSSQLGIGNAAQVLPRENFSTTLFTFEPEFTAAIKIMQFDKIKIGTGYRLALPAKSAGDLSTTNLSGFYGIVRLEYGIFDIGQRKAYLASQKPKPYLSGTYSMKFTQLNGQAAILDGGGTRIFLHRKFGIGISGYRTLKAVDYQGNDFSIVYGGAWLYYPFNMLKRVHLSISGLVGYGGVGYVQSDTQKMVGKGMPVIDVDSFANLNITEFMQLGLGLGYRLALTSFEDVEMSNISGITATLQLRVGAF